jgi:UPF0755 protein
MPIRMHKTVAAVLFLFVFFASIAGFLYSLWFASPYSGKAVAVVRLHRGEYPQSLFIKLQKRGLAPSGPAFRRYAHWVINSEKLKAGEYELKPGMTLQDLFTSIEKAKVKIRRFSIIPGWTVKRLLIRLNEQPTFKQANLSSAVVQDKLQLKHKKLEGLFYPATYRYYWESSAYSVLKKSQQKMQAVLEKEWASRQPGLAYKSAYEALIAASLIEKETHAKEERAIVSRVILNRLKKKMRLQIDPTVIYAWQDMGRQLVTSRMLKIDSPYNTYRRRGLPPTPICLPSGSAIHAALHPAKSNALYYVATGDGVHHHFSETYDQHLTYVAAYRRKIVEKKRGDLLGFPVTMKQFKRYWQTHCEGVHYWLPLVAGLGTLTEEGEWLLFPVDAHTHCRIRAPEKLKHQSIEHE